METNTSNGVNQNMPQGAKCSCPHHKVVPILIVLIGLTFLLNAAGVLAAQATAVIWPILLILVGLQKSFKGMCKCCSR